MLAAMALGRKRGGMKTAKTRKWQRSRETKWHVAAAMAKLRKRAAGEIGLEKMAESGENSVMAKAEMNKKAENSENNGERNGARNQRNNMRKIK